MCIETRIALYLALDMTLVTTFLELIICIETRIALYLALDIIDARQDHPSRSCALRRV